MLHGYEMIAELCEGLEAFMERHGFETVDEVVGRSLPYFTTHADLVERQARAREEKKQAGRASHDTMWRGDIAGEAQKLTS